MSCRWPDAWQGFAPPIVNFYPWLASAARAHTAPPPFAIGCIEDGNGTCPVEECVVDHVPFCSLRRFARAWPARKDKDGSAAREAVFVCAPLAGHHAVMMRESVESLLQHADVYITDWIDARDISPEAGPLSLEDYVLTLERFVRRAQREAGALHLLAVCQAAPPALAAAALRADAGDEPLASLTLIGGPIDARLNPTALERFAQSHERAWFRAWVIDTVPAPYVGATRRVYPGYLQQAAILTGHPERQFALAMRYWMSAVRASGEPLAQAQRAFDEYAAVLDMPEAYFLDTIEVVFQDALLARGLWRIGERPVRPAALSGIPLCTIEGGRDDITGAGQTHAAHALCANTGAPRSRLTIDDCDHYDLFTGPRWRDIVQPALRDFWRSLDTRCHAHHPE